MSNKSKARRSALVLAAALGVLACHKPEAPKPSLELKTEEDKAFYALGLDIGGNISVFALQPSELELVKLGLSDAVTQSKPKVDLDAVRPQLMELARKRSQVKSEGEKQKGKAAVEKAAKEPGAQQLPSGVVVKSLRPGTGASPTAADTVKVHYEGRLIDGTVFDSSYKRNEPASFPLGGVVPCWTQGLQQMKVGEKSQLTCPSDAAYGDEGRPPTIPGGATLVFDVELLEVAGK
jgi:FKBP-type peptidyl-prolyl cis-trans isomerase FkpA